MTIELPHDVVHAIRRLQLRTVRQLKSSDGERKRLAATLDAIAKQYGNDVIAPIKLLAERHDVQCVSTGFQPLDDIISGATERHGDKRVWVRGSGRGLPRGRIIEIWGPEASGKTTLCLELVRAFQELGLMAAYIDPEHALDMDYADRIGCDTEAWLYSPGGDDAESTLGMVDHLVKKEAVDIVVVDSVAALTPRAELEGEIGDLHVGLHARLMSQSLRKINGHLRRGHRTTVVFVNQTRQKIGVRFGDPETTTGGNALKFYASVRIRTSSMGELKKGGEIGMRGKVKVRKTKVGVPFGERYFDITGGNGITAMYDSDPRSKSKKDDGDDEDSDE